MLNILILISSLVISPVVWACLPHSEIQESHTPFESDILFFKTDEHVVIQQHLTYYQDRPYFNISLCMKNQGQSGFSLREAGTYNFEEHCRMLGSWIPVYTPDGEPVLSTLFAEAFEQFLSQFISTLERRSVLAPMMDTLKSMLTDYDNLFLMAAGATIVRQAYVIAPLANNINAMTSPKANKRIMRAGGILMVLGLLGLWKEASDRQTSATVHQEKLQEVVAALEHMESELEHLSREEPSTSDYVAESRIFSALVNALAFALATVEIDHGWVCLPPSNDPGIRYRQSI